MAAVPGLTHLCFLGRGSTATVSLAYDPSSGRLIAVKSAEHSAASPLRTEHRILSQLSSPYVISCFSSYVTDSHFHLLLEFAPGGSLFDCIGSGLDERIIGSYVRDILLGLSDLHSNEICHGDIKSRNVLIGSDGRAKIADFGASVRISDTFNGKLDALYGTPAFMAPEVARGEERGMAADVWALGCTILEMATGNAPWHGVIKDPDVLAAVYKIGFSSDSVPEIPNCLSKTAHDFLKKCLIRDPKNRWSVEQLLRHPFVCFDFDRVDSPQSALDFGFASTFCESDTEESESESESELESESGLDPFIRIQELVGSLLNADDFASDWDAGDCWIEVRSGRIEGLNRDDTAENGDDQFEFCEEDIESDLFLFSFGHVFERTVISDVSVGFENVFREFNHVCNANLTNNNKTMNTCFDQIMKLPPLFIYFFFQFFNYFCAISV